MVCIPFIGSRLHFVSRTEKLLSNFGLAVWEEHEKTKCSKLEAALFTSACLKNITKEIEKERRILKGVAKSLWEFPKSQNPFRK